MALWILFILQKESATGQKINISEHSHEIAVSSKPVRQAERSCWAPLPVAVAGAGQVGRVERPPGHRADGARRCSGLGEAAALAAKGRAGTVSASELS